MPGLRHVVTLTFRDDTSPETIADIVEALRALPGQIPALRQYVVGADVGKSDGNATVAIVADFDDWDGYVTYRDHPAHVAVGVEKVAPVLAGRGAVQHELS
ncbi:Dabb family protein [Actinospongicola halichondriae]|uniref:Dabb family protein n=1 Tax=Actinospongicola halichondriae TaxID=3236844 RepID=UPI003D39264D